MTTALLNDSLGSEQYEVMNSSMACRYPRWDSFEGRLLRTADLASSSSGRFRPCFGETFWFSSVCEASWVGDLHVPEVEHAAIRERPKALN